MSFASELQKVTQIESVDTILLEKIRWSMRQRLRKQMQLLCADLFDEVDDFLFSSGQRGQFADDRVYLKSMRELRTKQSLFEDGFLNRVMQHIKASYKDKLVQSDDIRPEIPSSQGQAMEAVEIDLALHALDRKAVKFYLSFNQQIAAINSRLNVSSSQKLFSGAVFITATTQSFSQAQTLFALPLEDRLVFIKLFEQHFLLKMDKMFLDVIRILKNSGDSEFIDKLYVSCSAFRTEDTPAKPTAENTQIQEVAKNEQMARKAAGIETAVLQLLSSECDSKELPQFIENMISSKWRDVMFMIGMNRGTNSIEWSEAGHTLSLLVAVVSNPNVVEASEHAAIKQRLVQGFDLIQMSEIEQENFVAELTNCFDANTIFLTALASGAPMKECSEKDIDSGRTVLAADTTEASISPSGEEILNRDDMQEIAKLLGDEFCSQDTCEQSNLLSEYLPDIEVLGEQAIVEFMISGQFQECSLKRISTNPDQYLLTTKSLRNSIQRSRLGLAMSLQKGELRLPRLRSNVAAMRTVLNSPLTRH